MFWFNIFIWIQQVEDGIVTFVDQNEVRSLMQDIIGILKADSSGNYKMNLKNFLKRFEETYDMPLTLETITGQLAHMVVLSPVESDEHEQRTIELSPLRIFAVEISQVLEDIGTSIMISSVEALYLQRYVLHGFNIKV